MEQLLLFSPEEKTIPEKSKILPKEEQLWYKKSNYELNNKERQMLFDAIIKRSVFIKWDITLFKIQTFLFGHSDLLFYYDKFNNDNRLITTIIRFELMALSHFNFIRQILWYEVSLNHTYIYNNYIIEIIKSFNITIKEFLKYNGTKKYVITFMKSLTESNGYEDKHLIECYKIHEHIRLFNEKYPISNYSRSLSHEDGTCFICGHKGIVTKNYVNDIAICPECFLQYEYTGGNTLFKLKNGSYYDLYDAQNNIVLPSTLYITPDRKLIYASNQEEVFNLKGELIGNVLDFNFSTFYKYN